MGAGSDEPTVFGGDGSPSAGELYDLYLDEVLEGRALSPERFLASHGVEDADLAGTLRRLYEGVTSRGGRDAGAGRSVGPFTLLRRLGAGGMGEVHLAAQESLGRQVALKLIRREYASSAAALERFGREARAAARLRHPHIATVYEVGEADGVHYIAMEYVRGRGLDRVLEDLTSRGGVMPAARVAKFGAALADALETAHREGIVHRDIKPSNILMTEDDRPMLLDFGLARDLREPGATMTEAFVGSPHYAAPEQVGRRGGVVDARTDVYSLGVVLYQCATGVVPFAGETLEQVLGSILVDDPPEPRRVRRSVPRDLSVIIAKAIHKEPSRRYQSAEALGEDLRAFLEYRPIAARPPGLVQRGAGWSRRHKPATAAIVTGMAAVVVAAGVFAWRGAAAARDRAREIDAALVEAQAQIGAYRDARQNARSLEQQYESAARERTSRYFPPERDAWIEEAEAEVRRVRSRRDLAFYSVLELAARAERLGGEVADVERVRGELYLERYFEAEVRGDREAMALYSDLVRTHDADGTLSDRLIGRTRLVVRCDAPGAAVYLFRRISAALLAEGAEPRLVSQPHGGEAPGPLDAHVLRVTRGAGDLSAGDIIDRVAGHPVGGSVLVTRAGAGVGLFARLVSVDSHAISSPYDLAQAERAGSGPREYVFDDAGQRRVLTGVSLDALGIEAAAPWKAVAIGGATVRAWTGEAWAEVAAEPGIAARPDASPAYLCGASLVGRAPELEVAIPSGSYLLVVDAPGAELYKLSVGLSRGEDRVITLAPLPEGTTEPGWVYVPPVPATHTDDPEHLTRFWIMEHEVTMAEYFEFLNDPEILARIDAAPGRLFHPFGTGGIQTPRDASGRIVLPDDWRPDWPVFLVSYRDAEAYAAWMTERARGAGRRVEYALPTQPEWVKAAGMAAYFVFGDEFRPKWVSSNFARPRPNPEPVMSFPIDQSPLGVFDMAGSISEWTDRDWREGTTERQHTGGAWGIGEEGYYKVYGGNGLDPELRSGVIGFRLVMRPLDDPGDS